MLLNSFALRPGRPRSREFIPRMRDDCAQRFPPSSGSRLRLDRTGQGRLCGY
jgi:hypothetical protein